MELTKKLNEEKGLEQKNIETSNKNFYSTKPQVFFPEYTIIEDYIRSLKCSCSCRCHGKC